MEENKTSVLSNGLIWFGAGVSMSEILTGTYFAPLGMKTGLLAILIGHVIGCIQRQTIMLWRPLQSALDERETCHFLF